VSHSRPFRFQHITEEEIEVLLTAQHRSWAFARLRAWPWHCPNHASSGLEVASLALVFFSARSCALVSCSRKVIPCKRKDSDVWIRWHNVKTPVGDSPMNITTHAMNLVDVQGHTQGNFLLALILGGTLVYSLIENPFPSIPIIT